MNLADARLLFLDLQTTGASPATGAPLEIAWTLGCADDAGFTTRGITSYLLEQPEGESVPRRIQSITGITEQDMEKAVDWNYAHGELRDAFKQAHLPAFVIHYAQFERPFLNELLAGNDTTWETICTHQIATRLFPNLPSRGIRGLAGYFGFPLEECKRAETHVVATHAIWKHLCKKLQEEKGISSIEELRSWLAETPRAKRTAYEYPLERGIRLAMPDCPGIYKMISRRGDVLYVGKATSLKDRVNSYFRGRKKRDPRKLEMLTQAWDIKIETCPTVLEACLLEVQEIKRLSPPYNIAMNTGNRPLVFYDRQFSAMSIEQSDDFPLGPFRNEFVLDAFIRLMQSLREGVWDTLIFFDDLPEQLIADGFEIFLQQSGLSREILGNPRSALAYGAWQRRLVAEEEAVEALGEDQIAGADQIASVDLPSDAEIEIELTSEDVAGKFHRLLMRAAGAYLLTRRLTRLLNSTIEFCDNGVERTLHFGNGVIVDAPTDAPQKPHPWLNLDIEHFDRMRVLSTELNRLRAAGYKTDERSSRTPQTSGQQERKYEPA